MNRIASTHYNFNPDITSPLRPLRGDSQESVWCQRPNVWAQQLRDDKASLDQLVRDRQAYVHPITSQPDNAKKVQKLGSIPVASVPKDGNNYAVMFERVPPGYDGVLTNVLCGFTGTGHVEGSGDIVWRLRIGNVLARNLGDVKFSLGSLAIEPQTIPGTGIQVVSNQYLVWYVAIPVGSPVGGAGAQIFAGFNGWYFPRR